MKKFFLIFIILITHILYAFNLNIDNIVINNLNKKNIFNPTKFAQHLKNDLKKQTKKKIKKTINNFRQKLDFTSRFAGIKATQNTVNILNKIYSINIVTNKNLIKSIKDEIAVFYYIKKMNFYLVNQLLYIIKYIFMIKF